MQAVVSHPHEYSVCSYQAVEPVLPYGGGNGLQQRLWITDHRHVCHWLRLNDEAGKHQWATASLGVIRQVGTADRRERHGVKNVQAPLGTQHDPARYGCSPDLLALYDEHVMQECCPKIYT